MYSIVFFLICFLLYDNLDNSNDYLNDIPLYIYKYIYCMIIIYGLITSYCTQKNTRIDIDINKILFSRFIYLWFSYI